MIIAHSLNLGWLCRKLCVFGQKQLVHTGKGTRPSLYVTCCKALKSQKLFHSRVLTFAKKILVLKLPASACTHLNSIIAALLHQYTGPLKSPHTVYTNLFVLLLSLLLCHCLLLWILKRMVKLYLYLHLKRKTH